MDCTQGEYYFLKGDVHVSMGDAVLSVTVTLFTATEKISSALSHVYTHMLKHVQRKISVAMRLHRVVDAPGVATHTNQCK